MVYFKTRKITVAWIKKNPFKFLPLAISALFGWLIQPDSASRNSIFLSREISQPFSQQYFPLTRNQPASQPASQPNKAVVC